MTWTHIVDGEPREETVLFMGVSVNPNTPGFDCTIYACIMDSNQVYHTVPVNQLSLSTEDYNKIFAG